MPTPGCETQYFWLAFGPAWGMGPSEAAGGAAGGPWAAKKGPVVLDGPAPARIVKELGQVLQCVPDPLDAVEANPELNEALKSLRKPGQRGSLSGHDPLPARGRHEIRLRGSSE